MRWYYSWTGSDGRTYNLFSVPDELLLPEQAYSELEKLLKTFTQLDLLTKFLQSELGSIHEVPALFDLSIELFECLAEHCSVHPSIVRDPDFKSAICKIQRHEILEEKLNLTDGEAHCVAHLKVVEPSNTPMVTGREDEVDAMEAILRSVKMARVERASNYIDCRFIRPTSNRHTSAYSVFRSSI